MSLAPTHPEDYRNAIAKLSEVSPIASKQYLGLVGQTQDGNMVFIPGSYEKGYADSLLPPGLRPYYTWNLLVVGQLSDGTFVFPPSYESGLNHGRNDLRFAILAEGEKRLARENQDLWNSLDQLRDEIARLKNERQAKGTLS
jgi:hypothetical protein